MTINSKLGNRPDTTDMAQSLAVDSEAKKLAPATHPELETEDEEEEAARLGDFA